MWPVHNHVYVTTEDTEAQEAEASARYRTPQLGEMWLVLRLQHTMGLAFNHTLLVAPDYRLSSMLWNGHYRGPQSIALGRAALTDNLHP